MKTIDELVSLVNDWAKEKGIHEKGNKKAQLLKTHEELGELISAHINKDTELKKDSVGDILVTLINATWFEKQEVENADFSIVFKFAYQKDDIKKLVEENSETDSNEILAILSNILIDMLFERKYYGLALTAFLININMYCYLENIDSLECLEIAYNTISKRTGHMDSNGQFIKDK